MRTGERDFMNRRFLVSVLALAVLTASAFAQATTQLSGTVSDPAGAVVPGATIELVNSATGTRRETTTDALGNYSFAQLQPGTYQMTAKSAGFAAVTVSNIRLEISTPATLPIRLEIGSTAEAVTVSSEALQVNTTDATIGNAFGTKPILQLPFEGRNVVGLLSLQPGVTFAGENVGTSNTADNGAYRQGSVLGGKSDQANVTLDGVDVNDQQRRDPFTSVLRLTLDSVQEFRVTTTNANADQGRSSGAQITLVTKSGANDFHGSLYWFLRNRATNANSFFNNLAGVPLAKLNRNIYGGSIGGPIAKNRAFFFVNYEGREDRREESVNRTVPTASLRAGTVRYIRTDGSIADLSPADLRSRIDPLGIGPSQNALAQMQKYPLPNNTQVGDGINTAGFQFNSPLTLKYNTTIARMDFNLDEEGRHHLFARGNLQDDAEVALVPQFPGQPPNNNRLANTKGIALGLTSVLSPSIVNNFRYGITRLGQENSGVSMDPIVTFRTIADIVPAQRPFIQTIPVYTIADDFSWTKGRHDIKVGGVVRLTRNRRNNFANSFPSASTNSSWLVNSGAELNAPLTDIRPQAINSYRDAAMAVLGVVSQGNARYNFEKDGIALPVGAAVVRQFRQREFEFYAQDTWRATRDLTITAGLRWSGMPPIFEAFGTQTVSRQPLNEWFSDRAGAAAQGLPQSIVRPVEYVLKEQPGGRDLYPFHKDNFAPRLALAYSPSGTDGLSKFLFGGPGKTAIRAGWGMFYDMMGSGLITNYDATALGLSTALTNPSAVLSLSDAPRYIGPNQIPPSILPPAPPAGFPQVAPNIFAITNSLDDELKAPYTMNMNFSFGREFGQGWFVQGSYAGRLSRRSLMSEDIAMPTNLRDPASGVDYFTAATELGNLANANTPTANIQPIPYWENIFPGLATSTLTATQRAYQRFAANAPDWTYALYQMDVLCQPACSKFGPYAFYNPQFSYLRTLRANGRGSYHGMLWTARKRFTNADQIEFNYTWSKSIDLASTPEISTALSGVVINAFNRQLFRAVSDYDLRHQWNANFVYGLPFGRGKKFVDQGGIVDAIIGGWQLSGLYRQSTGLPTGIGNGRFWPTNWNVTGLARATGTFEDGTNRNGPAPPGGTSGPNLFQDPSAAVNAFDYELPGGVGARNNVRGDGNFNIDLGLAKSFRIIEGHFVQFRWEVFNVTNTARFDPFTASGSLGTLGSFGKYTETLTNPRVMQFAIRYDF
jgi:hypothetical protein